MAVSTKPTVEVASALAEILSEVEGLRVVWYVADNARPPVAIIAQPSIDYVDPASPFCSAAWTFGVSIAVNRNQDLQAQKDLSRLVSECVRALDEAEVEGIFSIEPQLATPTTLTISGVDMPGYTLRLVIRA
jgi:hypothetical protein